MRVSKLKIFSLGIVAANKALGSDLIEVTPIEDVPMVDGEITDNGELTSTPGVDSDGAAYDVSAVTSVAVQAKWLPIYSSNRVTAPDVRRGETVVLYQFDEVNDLYWATLQYDMQLRKLETVVYAFSATKDEAATGQANNTYYFEVSTHRKLIHLHTSQANAEPFGYDVQINADEGFFEFTDTDGNYVRIDSTNTRIEVENAAGNRIDMDKGDVTWTVPGNFTIEVGGNYTKSVGGNFNSTVSGSEHRSISSGVTIETPTITGDANQTNLTGNLQVGGVSDFVGGGVTSGNGTFYLENVEARGTVHANQVISDQDIIAPNVQ